MNEDAKGLVSQLETSYSERAILDMVGSALLYCTLLLAAYSPLLATSATSSPVMHGVTHGTMFLGMAVFYLIVSRIVKSRESFVRSRIAQAIFLAFQLPLPCAILLENYAGVIMPAAVSVALWAALGVSCGFFFCAWVDAQSVLVEQRIRKDHLRAFGLAGIITVVVLCMPFSSGAVMFALLCIGQFCLLLSAPPEGREQAYDHDDTWFNTSRQYSFNGSYAMTIDGITIGVIAGLLVARASKDVLPPSVVGLTFVGVAILFAVLDRKAPALLALGKGQLFFLPLIICGFILSGFLEAPFNTIAVFPLFIIMYLFDYTNSLVLTMRGSLISASPSLCFSHGRFFMALGQAIGWFIGGFHASDIGHGSMPITSVLLIMLMCVYVTIAVVRPDKYSFAGSTGGAADSIAANAGNASTISGDESAPPPRPIRRGAAV